MVVQARDNKVVNNKTFHRFGLSLSFMQTRTIKMEDKVELLKWSTSICQKNCIASLG
jgi:hypothetical protein